MALGVAQDLCCLQFSHPSQTEASSLDNFLKTLELIFHPFLVFSVLI